MSIVSHFSSFKIMSHLIDTEFISSLLGSLENASTENDGTKK